MCVDRSVGPPERSHLKDDNDPFCVDHECKPKCDDRPGVTPPRITVPSRRFSGFSPSSTKTMTKIEEEPASSSLGLNHRFHVIVVVRYLHTQHRTFHLTLPFITIMSAEKEYTLGEVAEHTTTESCWLIIGNEKNGELQPLNNNVL